MMALQCDLQLPTCKNCRVADVECFFWDDSLGQDIPCSYLYSLRQRVSNLQLEIQDIKEKGHSKAADVEDDNVGALLKDLGYHLNLTTDDDQSSASNTAYLGPGSSARLMEHILKSTVQWHIANNVPIPERLLPNESSSQKRGLHDSKPPPSFSMTFDQKKYDLHTLVPPSTQRAIIEHYMKTISPEYTLLSSEHETALLSYENPLRWSNAHKSDPSALALTIVMAVSSALITRDLDSSLKSLSMRCREDVQKLTEREAPSAEEQVDFIQTTCTAFCALALCELITPTSGQFWGIMGKATSTLEQLRDGYHFNPTAPDTPFKRLEYSLLKLESHASLHLRRPSQICQLKMSIIPNMPPPLPEDIALLGYLLEIRKKLPTATLSAAKYIENIIPLSMQVYSAHTDISIQSATLYTSLHPLFTGLDIISSSPDFASDPYLSQLYQIIAKCACIIIDDYTRLNNDNKIISLWIAAERVMECGSVWAFFLISRRCRQPVTATTATTAPTATTSDYHISTRDAMMPILKVSTLLASFAARWAGCAAYVDAWETLVEMLWGML